MDQRPGIIKRRRRLECRQGLTFFSNSIGNFVPLMAFDSLSLNLWRFADDDDRDETRDEHASVTGRLGEVGGWRWRTDGILCGGGPA